MSLNGYQSITAGVHIKATAKAGDIGGLKKIIKEGQRQSKTLRCPAKRLASVAKHTAHMSPAQWRESRSGVHGGPGAAPHGAQRQSRPREAGGRRGRAAQEPVARPPPYPHPHRQGAFRNGGGGVRPSAVSRHLYKMADTFSRGFSPSRRQTTAATLTPPRTSIPF